MALRDTAHHYGPQDHAPQAILDLLACNCATNYGKWTQMYRLLDYENQADGEESADEHDDDDELEDECEPQNLV